MQQPKAEVKLHRTPSWDVLYERAATQQGCFTREQAREAGFSDQLLHQHLAASNIERLLRGIYRVTRFPESGREQEDLVVVWLWSQSAGVFSHETALRLHGLSDALPSKIHLTLPGAWRGRKLTPPPGVRVYFADFARTDCTFIGAIPVIKPARTINDVAAANGDAATVEVAIRQALQRGLAAPAELLPAVEYLASLRAGAWRVFPEAVADLQGHWQMEVVSGTCRSAPPIDWRTDAEDFARGNHGRLRGAHYSPGSRTMTIEIIWPVPSRDNKPISQELRAQAVAHFGWMS
jgi:predicted transcriptional regulator of viral defense system